MTPNRDGKEDEKVEFSTCPGQKRRSCGVASIVSSLCPSRN